MADVEAMLMSISRNTIVKTRQRAFKGMRRVGCLINSQHTHTITETRQAMVSLIITHTRPKKSGKGSPRSRAKAHVKRETDASDEKRATRPFQESMTISTVAPAVEPVA